MGDRFAPSRHAGENLHIFVWLGLCFAVLPLQERRDFKKALKAKLVERSMLYKIVDA